MAVSPTPASPTGPDRRVPKKGRIRQRERIQLPEDAGPIVTRRLSKRYGDLVAVDNLELDVRAGEIFGLLGQNGAGKTTTILMLLGLAEPSADVARVVGFDPTRNPLEVKQRVGYLPDNVGFYDGMTGRENLRYTARLNGIPREEAEERIDAVLEQVGMTSRADTNVDTYSRGMLQRLGIADALVKDPAVLILDEPTTAIDPIGVVEILDLLRTLVRERGLAVLLSSHLLAQVQSVCDRVGIFASGKLIGVGTVAELAERFGFAANNIEIVVDAPSEENADIAEALRAVAGVTDARLSEIPSERESGGEDDNVSRSRRALARRQAVELAAFAVGGGLYAAAGTHIRHRRELRNFEATVKQNPEALPAVAERVWVVTFEPDRAIHEMISAIVLAMSAFHVVRIGRAEASLDDIYRAALHATGLANRMATA